MARKLSFYDRYGVAEYYIYDPDTEKLSGYLRTGIKLQPINNLAGWVSPVLGIRFEPNPAGLAIYFPDGERFLSVRELHQEREEAQQQVREANLRIEEANLRIKEAHQRSLAADNRAKEAAERAERLAEKLRALGIDPDSV